MLAVSALAQQTPPAPGPPPTIVKVKDDLFIVQNQANTMGDLIAYGGNATAYVTDAGVMLIDSKSDREHDDLDRQTENRDRQAHQVRGADAQSRRPYGRRGEARGDGRVGGHFEPPIAAIWCARAKSTFPISAISARPS